MRSKMSLTRKGSLGDSEQTLIRRCMAIMLKPVTSDASTLTSSNKGESHSTATADSRDSNGIFEGPGPPGNRSGANHSGSDIFDDFVKENTDCYWNPSLVQSVNSLEYRGCLSPCTVLVSGTEFNLEVIRSAWSRRLLRPPNGYAISLLGDLDPVKVKVVQQTQFAPLPEALCKVVFDLNTEGIVANMTVIGNRLKTTFPEILLPEENLLYRTLGSLIKERKLYHTGNGYSVVTPETFRLLAISPPVERQMLLTNDEAIVKLHGTSFMDGRSACTQTNQRDSNLVSWSSAERILSPARTPTSNGKLKRCHSLKLLRSKDKDKLSRTNSFKASRACPVVPLRETKSDAENLDTNKKEKQPSMFSKLFRRGRVTEKKTPKCTSISSQFPPRDRSDPDYVYYNSRATQTLESDDQLPPRSYKSRSSSLSRMTGKEHRHSLHVNGATANSKRPQHHKHQTDVYHYRSSSVPRRSSPSPKRDATQTLDYIYASTPRKTSPKPPSRQRQRQQISSTLPSTSSRPPPSGSSKTRPKYESLFSPIAKSDELLLRAGDKYGEETATVSSVSNGMWPWRPAGIGMARPTQGPLSRPYQNSPLSWRPPSSNTNQSKPFVEEPKKPQPVVGVPQKVFPRGVARVLPSAANKPQGPSIFAQNVTKNDGPIKKNLSLGGNVDVEISVSSGTTVPGKPGASTDSQTKKDSLKVDSTWKQSVSNKTSTVVETNAKNGGQILSSVMNITATVTHGSPKAVPGTKVGETSCAAELVKGRSESPRNATVVDCTGKCTIVREMQNAAGASSSSRSVKDVVSIVSPPRSPAPGDAKRDFFTESPSPSDPHCSKDDSGFSSSTSTSRPMSVSPC